MAQTSCACQTAPVTKSSQVELMHVKTFASVVSKNKKSHL